MDPTREAARLADLFEVNFERRRQNIVEWNRALDEGTYKPSGWIRLRWRIAHRLGFGAADGRRKVGLAMALSDTFFWEFWSGGLFKVVGDLAQVTSPLVLKRMISFVTRSGMAAKGVEGYTMPSVRDGLGLAFGLFFMQLRVPLAFKPSSALTPRSPSHRLYSVCTAQTLSRCGQVGVLARGTLIAVICELLDAVEPSALADLALSPSPPSVRRAMVMSGRARVTITNSKLVSHISTDISRVDL